MTTKSLLIDFDDTLVDFHDAEAYAFYKMTKQFQITTNENDLKIFMKINQAHWDAFQQNELTKAEVLSKRFEAYFHLHQMTVDGKLADQIFRDELANAPIKHFDLTIETLKQLKEEHDLYIVTNGVLETQERRIAKTKIGHWFKGVFVSEQTGFQKPMPEFFDYVFNEIGEDKRNNAMIIGDSISSDILGGKNAGIETCWFNPRHKDNDTEIKPDYVINVLSEMISLV
ncbi:YjjG family noncanonical pyrimidine nucleotidase [Staphylococcus edaphicus]|uniref:Noncanonical pyrimidine nucleotidase, YjjG family n=1 Tax=Staphylococcus edaphicus TaxID=1955013 RepID=A0A2C6WIN6_9STAP|nr:YjjG family noncanonical pyrimidine nucleotidase [Staphylococcus edaphicus]PHK50648.1 noncanonical pyrimidine nucleotidase, YjjG family [Staphylococcus edaphicus]UQW80680.1 YjjG family noncanonical pyrimidine nucleotidase [Staphylococcus edaphicus]